MTTWVEHFLHVHEHLHLHEKKGGNLIIKRRLPGDRLNFWTSSTHKSCAPPRRHADLLPPLSPGFHINFVISSSSIPWNPADQSQWLADTYGRSRRSALQPAWGCGTSLCLSVAASCQLLAKIVTDYLLIPLLFQSYSCVRRCLRVSRSSSLDFCQPTSPTSPSALSPWKPSPTGFAGCLRRRPVPLTTGPLIQAHLTGGRVNPRPSPALIRLI